MKAGSRRFIFLPLFLVLCVAALFGRSFVHPNAASAQTTASPAKPSAAPAPTKKPVAYTASFAQGVPFDPAVEARIKADIAALTAFKSRVPGTPDYIKAANLIEDRFRALGLKNVRHEEFPVTVPVTKTCQITIGGRTMPLLPLYPNSVVPACTPEKGLDGQLIYAAAGRPSDYNGLVVKGSIVALDFDSGMNWTIAADLGARAVIFLAPDMPSPRNEAETKFSNLPVEFPRFYAPKDTANAMMSALGLPFWPPIDGVNFNSLNVNPPVELLKLGTQSSPMLVTAVTPAQRASQKPAPVSLLSLVKWEAVKGRNILGEVPGTDAALAKKPGDTLVVDAYYDSMSIAPDLAPGAEPAGNMAALLEVARTFKAKPQRYSLLFVANGAHHIALAGARNFLAQHFLERPATKDAKGKEIPGTGGPTKKDKDNKDIKEPAFYKGFIGLDLTSRTGTVGLFAKSVFYNQMGAGSENILLNQFADFAKQINDWVDDEATARKVKPETFYVDGVTGKDGRSWRSYLPSLVAMDSEAATMAQKPGISFVTANDARNLQDTPFDLPQFVDTKNLARQVGTITWVMNKAFGPLPSEKASKDKVAGFDLLPDSSLFSQNFGYAVGRAIYRNVKMGSSFLPDTPIPDENMPISAPIISAADEKKMQAEIAASSDPKQAQQIQEKLDRRKEREAQRLADLASLKGTMALGQVLNRGSDYKSYSGVRGAFIERAQFSKGTPPLAEFVFVGPRVGDPKGGGTPDAEIENFSVNSAGRVIFAPDMGSERSRFSPRFKKTNPALTYKNEATKELAVDSSTICFECRGTALHDTLDQRYFSVLSEMTVLDASTDAGPVEFGFMQPQAPGGGTAWKEPIGIVYSKPNATFKLIMAAGLLGKRLVIVHTQPRSQQEMEALAAETGKAAPTVAQRDVYPEGNGVFVPEDSQVPNAIVHVAYQTARDLWALDQMRIGLLKRFGINNERVDKLHSEAGGGINDKGKMKPIGVPESGALKEADEKLAALQYDEFYLAARRAFGLESRAYPDVEATSQDVLKGIIFYLALLLPFSFFLERLLFGFPDVRKQIMGTSLSFGLIFLGIRYVHPAFELALTPFIILLAFIILALTVVVTSFLSGKFEAEIKRLKQGVHFADVGRLSALGAAFGLGIANMRRRPTRTALTCVTLVLLTFTVLSFTSVTANINNFAKKWGDHTPKYQGVLVRQPDWGSMQQSAVNSMANEFKQRFDVVARRAWYLSRDQGEALQLRVSNVENPAKFFHAPALLGLTPEEQTLGSPITKTIKFGTWFQKDNRRDVCLMPLSQLQPPKQKAETKAPAGSDATPEDTGPPLGLTPETAVGQWVQVAGQPLQIIGVFDDSQWYPDEEARKAKAEPLYDIDGEEFTPVDYSNDQNKQAQQQTSLSGQKGEEVQVQRYQHMDANAMLILPYRTVLDLGGSTRSIAASFSDPAKGQEELQDLMKRAALGIFGTDKEKDGTLVAKLYSSVESAGYEGFASLVIPILIAALIIANTMLGSVYERTREIGIYSSVGLAPIHVAALFIAEAVVYAVLGSISGYLVAQAVAKILTVYNLLPGITLNYSSSSAVIATLIVMLTVLLSTLYPAWAASRMSQPDIERRWKMSAPTGDIWRFQFPFTVSGQQPLGVAQFLCDFFNTHTDTSVGRFYTDKVHFNSLTLRDAVDMLNEGVLMPEDMPPPTAREARIAAKAEAKIAAKKAAKIAAQAAASSTVDGAATPNVAATNGKTEEAAPPETVLLNLSGIHAPPDTEVYRIAMRVWLAPFDMGVSQDSDIVLLPSAEPGLYELQLRLARQSGEIAAWQRVNRGFISDLRKQLLLWRTIPREMQQEYILTGRAHVTGQVAPLEAPGAVVGSSSSTV